MNQESELFIIIITSGSVQEISKSRKNGEATVYQGPVKIQIRENKDINKVNIIWKAGSSRETIESWKKRVATV